MIKEKQMHLGMMRGYISCCIPHEGHSAFIIMVIIGGGMLAILALSFFMEWWQKKEKH